MQAVLSGLRMTLAQSNESGAIYLSLGIFAWNEERAIGATLASLFQQTLFEELSRRNLRCEVVCVTNGCTDRTASIARGEFATQRQTHPYAPSFATRVVEIAQRGKVNAWNRFVHEVSAPGAQHLVMMDADILIHRRETIWNMVVTLERDQQAAVAVDRPCKDILFKQRRSWRDWFSLAVSQITLFSAAQLCAQLYCMRASIARGIYLPKDLPACEDGLIKTLVCTDNLSHGVQPERLALAKEAEHTFEAYTTPGAILRNQKRQVIGQTVIHLLVDQYLKALPLRQRQRLAETLRDNDARDPDWLKRLMSDHLQSVRWFWQLYPGLLSYRFRRLRQLSLAKKVLCFPAACASAGATLVASFSAYRALKSGLIDYWPKAERLGLQEFKAGPLGIAMAKSTTGK